MLKRNKAWRKAKKKAKANRFTESSSEIFLPEKNWKMMTFRSEKLRRAQKLGLIFPRITLRQLLEQEMED